MLFDISKKTTNRERVGFTESNRSSYALTAFDAWLSREQSLKGLQKGNVFEVLE